jgi:hypothetical protein
VRVKLCRRPTADAKEEIARLRAADSGSLFDLDKDSVKDTGRVFIERMSFGRLRPLQRLIAEGIKERKANSPRTRTEWTDQSTMGTAHCWLRGPIGPCLGSCPGPELMARHEYCAL